MLEAEGAGHPTPAAWVNTAITLMDAAFTADGLQVNTRTSMVAA